MKRTFNRVSLELHPDKGGTKEAFIELLDQYQRAKQQFSGDTARVEDEKEADKPFPERPEPGIRGWGRWWVKLSQQELWDLIKAEHQANNKTVAQQNQDSLEKENESFEEGRCYTKRERAMLNVDYESLGSVGEMLISRKAQSMESLLAEMKEKRECGPSFKAPSPSSDRRRNKRKRTIDRRSSGCSKELRREP